MPHERSVLNLPLDVLRRDRTSAKWRSYPGDVLPLWVAELDAPLAEPVVDTVRAAIERGDTGYPSGSDYPEALAAFARTRWDWELDPEHTALVPDVMLGAAALLRELTAPGAAVVVNPPVYPPFFAYVALAERSVHEAPLGAGGRLDLDGLERAYAAAGRGAAHLLCNPHNPTGTVHTPQELTAVAELAEAAGVRVIADEIHAPLVLPGARFTPYLSLPAAARGCSLMSASKGWNLAGLKAALAIAGPDSATELAAMPEDVGDGASHLAVMAHTAAYAAGGEWLDALLADLDANRRLLSELLEEHLPAVRRHPSEATFLAWLDCGALGLGDDPAGAFLERARVAVNPGHDFRGSTRSSHVRLNFGTSPAVLAEAVQRMARLS